MPDPRAGVPASGTVHWVGAGLSTGSGLAGLCDAPTAYGCGTAPRPGRPTP